MKRMLAGIVLFLCALAAGAQTTTITASNIAAFGGAPITGTFCLTPVNQVGQPINLTTPSGQQFWQTTPTCFAITSGVLATAVVPDTSQTQPENACYRLTINNSSGSRVGGYPCIQPQGATWSFDAYVPASLPSIPALTLPQFELNGVPNRAQGYLNFICTWCTVSGGNITLPSQALPSIANSTVLGNVSGASAAASALTASQLSTLLGLGTAATQASSAFDAAGAAATAQSNSLQKSNNLSDLANAANARTSLGLGTAAQSNTSAFDSAGAAAAAQSAAIAASDPSGSAATAETAAQAASLPRSFFTVGTGGVTANLIVAFDSNGHTIASTGSGFGGLAASTVAATGTVEVVRSGIGTCIFDGAAAIGDIAIPSTTTPGECHDSGFTSSLSVSSSVPVVGAIESTVASSGATGTIRLHGPGVFGGSGSSSGLPSAPGAGYAPVSTQAGTQNYTAQQVPTAITTNLYTINGLNLFGDSITTGTGATSLTYAYATLLCNAYGQPCANYAVSGDMAADEATFIYADLNPTRYENAPATSMIGTNDANHVGATTGGENNFFHALLAGVAWATIPYEFKIQPQLGITASNCTTTGTWTNTTYGNVSAISSIVPGSTLSCTSLTQGDSAVYASWFAQDGLTATATFSIDGTQVDTWDAFGFNGQVIDTIHGLTSTPFATRYALTGTGSHTYKVTVGTAGTSNAFTVLWMGSPAPPTPVNLGGPTQNPPRMAVAGVIRQSQDADSAATAAYNTLGLSVATTLAADGALAFPVNVRNYVDLDYATLDSDMAGTSTTLPNGLITPASTSTPIHPNGGISNGVIVGGHRHIADAFLAAMPPPVNTYFNGGYYAGTATGIVNNMSVSLPGSLGTPTQAQLTGILFSFIPNLTNTSNIVNLNVNGLGAITAIPGPSLSFANGDFVAGTVAFVVYNGTNYVLLNPQSAIIQKSTSAATGWQATALIAPSLRGAGGGTAVLVQGGLDTSSSSALGSLTARGANNSGAGNAGSAFLQSGVNTSSGNQGFANMQQSYQSPALSATFEVVAMGTTSDLIVASPLAANNNVGVAQTAGGTVSSGTYTSGITATGSASQTCALTSFSNSSTATATVSLTGTNTIASGTALVITSAGTGATAAPTSATAGNGTATCSGTATIATNLSPIYVVNSGKTTARFDGTPVVGDVACYPPTSTGTIGLAHDNGLTACTLGESLGVITGQVSGSGSGATATVLLK